MKRRERGISKMCLLRKLKINRSKWVDVTGKINNTNLITTNEYDNLTPEEKAEICNGMGSEVTWWNRLLKKIIPDHFFGLDMTEAADIHDFMYWKGGNLFDKITADLVFLYNMLSMIHAAGPKNRTKRYFMATRYFLAVFWGGKSSFNFKN